MKKWSKSKLFLVLLFIAFAICLLIPQRLIIPVENADKNSYNSNSFWFYPWGKSGSHKGVDIFANEGTNVKAATNGLVVYTGEIQMGGNVILILGPQWRLYYYAHLRDIDTKLFSIVSRNQNIGTVGTSVNAKGKSPHLHFVTMSLIPYPWRIDNSHQGWRKMFYLNPIDSFTTE